MAGWGWLVAAGAFLWDGVKTLGKVAKEVLVTAFEWTRDVIGFLFEVLASAPKFVRIAFFLIIGIALLGVISNWIFSAPFVCIQEEGSSDFTMYQSSNFIAVAFLKTWSPTSQYTDDDFQSPALSGIFVEGNIQLDDLKNYDYVESIRCSGDSCVCVCVNQCTIAEPSGGCASGTANTQCEAIVTESPSCANLENPQTVKLNSVEEGGSFGTVYQDHYIAAQGEPKIFPTVDGFRLLESTKTVPFMAVPREYSPAGDNGQVQQLNFVYPAGSSRVVNEPASPEQYRQIFSRDSANICYAATGTSIGEARGLLAEITDNFRRGESYPIPERCYMRQATFGGACLEGDVSLGTLYYELLADDEDNAPLILNYYVPSVKNIEIRDILFTNAYDEWLVAPDGFFSDFESLGLTGEECGSVILTERSYWTVGQMKNCLDQIGNGVDEDTNIEMISSISMCPSSGIEGEHMLYIPPRWVQEDYVTATLTYLVSVGEVQSTADIWQLANLFASPTTALPGIISGRSGSNFEAAELYSREYVDYGEAFDNYQTRLGRVPNVGEWPYQIGYVYMDYVNVDGSSAAVNIPGLGGITTQQEVVSTSTRTKYFKQLNGENVFEVSVNFQKYEPDEDDVVTFACVDTEGNPQPVFGEDEPRNNLHNDDVKNDLFVPSYDPGEIVVKIFGIDFFTRQMFIIVLIFFGMIALIRAIR